MRRAQPDTHAAHREEQHHLPHNHTNDEPLKRSYERVVDGEDPPTEDKPDQALAVEPVQAMKAEPAPAVKSEAPTGEAAEADVDQELAWVSGSSAAKYGSLKKEDTDKKDVNKKP